MTIHQKLLDARGSVSHADQPLVPVFCADNRPEATRYCAMLEQADIPAWVGDDLEGNGRMRQEGFGTFVLVPESYQNHAAELIASRCAVSGIDDDDMDDDDDDDDDDDLFDDADDSDFDDDDDDADDDWDD